MKNKLFLHPPSLVWCFFLSTAIALILAVFLSPPKQESYLLLQAAADSPTVVQVFFDTGSGFSEQVSVKQQLRGGFQSQSIRYSLPSTRVRKLRVDFEGKGNQVNIEHLALVDTKDEVVVIEPDKLKELRDISLLTVDSKGSALVTWQQPDPQVLVNVNRSFLSSIAVSPGLVFALVFMMYPLVVFQSRFSWNLVRKRGRPYCKFSIQPTLLKIWVHNVCIVLAIIIWCCAGVYCWLEVVGKKSLIGDQGNQVIQAYKKDFDRQALSFQRKDGLKISARVYRAKDTKGKIPALLLLHGNYPAGQMFPLYQVMAQEFALKGYLVMTIDFAGYGHSEDPFAGEVARRVDLEMETRAAITYLADLPLVKSDQIGVIGHSMGADPALRVGMESDQVSTVVLVGPPRRVWERFHYPPDRDFFWHWAHHIGQQQYGRATFPEWYTKELWLKGILARDMVHMRPKLRSWHHKPVLFVDGQREPAADKDFLRCYAKESSFPKKYKTLYKADHNCNVSARNGQILYNPSTMEQLTTLVDNWYVETVTGKPRWSDYLRNILDWLFGMTRFTTC